MSSKEAYWFPHEHNARNDPKLVRLAMDGLDLIGLFWDVVEMLHEQGGWMPIDSALIAYALRTEKERVDILINFPGLFIIKDGMFTSKRVLENLNKRQEKREKAQASASKRWDSPNAMPTQYEGIARKGDERKSNERTVNERTAEKMPEAASAAPTPASAEGISPVEITAISPDDSSPVTSNIPVNPGAFLSLPEQMNILLEQWNSIVPWKVKDLTPNRKRCLADRLEEPGFFENFGIVANKVVASDFLSNRKHPLNDRDWKATFDWVIKDSENWIKVLEGNYDNDPSQDHGRV